MSVLRLLRQAVIDSRVRGRCVGLACKSGPSGQMLRRRDLILLTLPGFDAQDVHGVKFLKCPTLALDDAKEDDGRTGEETARENISVGEVDLRGDKAGEETNEEVPEPVGGSRKGHTSRTVARGIQFGNDSPDHRTPGTSVSDNEQAGEDNHGNSRLWGVFRSFDIQGEVANGGEDHEAHEHPGSTDNQGLATAEVLDVVQTKEGGAEIHSTENNLGDVAVADASSPENHRTKVEEVVGTSELLQHLQQDTENESIEHPWCCENRPPWVVLRGVLLLGFLLHLQQLSLK